MSTFMTGLGSMLGRKSQSPPSAKTSGPKVDSYSAGSQEAFDLSHHSALLQAFPNALPVSVFKSRVKHMLKAKGMDATTTLLSTSFCCDEVNRSFESAMASDFSGHSFNLGGLSGFPFAGTVGIGAMASHIPKDGSAFIIYGPHVGFANTHDVGKVERKGIAEPNGCCGSAIAAMNSICQEHKTCWQNKSPKKGKRLSPFKGKAKNPSLPPLVDIQQYHVCQQVTSAVDIEASSSSILLKSSPSVSLNQTTLPTAVYDAITPDVDFLLGTTSPQPSLLKKALNLALIGGILINTAPEHQDYFLPLRFELFNPQQTAIANLLPELQNFDSDAESN
ncbi:hypothetical protein TrVE_jg2338 [Triparma verrucosa]|uniref:Limiting CO2-inducible protein B/C beta carbonyic anhydrase domain-containing protein n=1 Tax=Triparma verrucosa TaxID=1606542 RepID=A0A9W7KT96_9STRA|nr:hypothetical protein TrVE_jg2338 [Triparma verrucosa]